MRFGVRMEDHLKSKAALDKVSHFVRSVDESPPSIGIKTDGTYWLASRLGCVCAIDQIKYFAPSAKMQDFREAP